MKTTISGKLVSVASQLDGLGELFDAAADAVQDGQTKCLSYTAVIGMGAILSKMGGEVGELAGEAESLERV